MRLIDYTREEFHAPDEEQRAPLPVFLLDVPGLLVRGVLPPLHLLNEILAQGHMGGGMSPGARWNPFEITSTEYSDVIAGLAEAAREGSITHATRFVPNTVRLDPELGHHTDFIGWVRAVCAKYPPEG